uniref:Uncharacterized protein n=1 Tax=Globodera rostochiensis TaxID=31243 RepID=A0A914HUT5_GLORO
MEKFRFFILLAFYATNSLDKAESVQLEELEELPLQTFDELFVDEWWDKDEAEGLKTPAPTNFGQNVHHQIDRQNTQIGQIEPNSTDQNPTLTESDHSDYAKNGEDQNEITSNAEDERKRKIVDEFHAMKDGKKKMDRKNLVEKFDQMKAELNRDGFKNSYYQEIDKTVAKELGLSLRTIFNWKRELGQTEPSKYLHSEQTELMKRYYEIKGTNPKISDKEIAKMLKIGRVTLVRWKKQFERQ